MVISNRESYWIGSRPILNSCDLYDSRAQYVRYVVMDILCPDGSNASVIAVHSILTQ